MAEHVVAVADLLAKVNELEARLEAALADLRVIYKGESLWSTDQARADREGRAAAIPALLGSLPAVLADLGRASDQLYVRLAHCDGYWPATVARRMTPDPLDVSWLLAVAAAVSGLAWLGGVWPGRYAADVADNVLVGGTEVMVGAGLLAVVLLLRHRWLTDQARPIKNDLESAVSAVRSWTYVGGNGDWQRNREDPRSQVTEERAISEARHARPTLRAALHRLQHLTADPRLDATGDLVDDLIVGALGDRDNTELMQRLTAALDRLAVLVAEAFPGPLSEHKKQMNSLFGVWESPSSSQPWDAELAGLGPADVRDPSAGPWAARGCQTTTTLVVVIFCSGSMVMASGHADPAAHRAAVAATMNPAVSRPVRRAAGARGGAHQCLGRRVEPDDAGRRCRWRSHRPVRRTAA